jgi:hypothetical protein
MSAEMYTTNPVLMAAIATGVRASWLTHHPPEPGPAAARLALDLGISLGPAALFYPVARSVEAQELMTTTAAVVLLPAMWIAAWWVGRLPVLEPDRWAYAIAGLLFPLALGLDALWLRRR